MKNETKPQAGGRPRRNPKSASTATFSIRFTPEERGWVEEAAGLRQEPAAALARKGAVDRALDFLNFNGAEDELRLIAEKLVSRLNPALLRGGVSKPKQGSEAQINDEKRVSNQRAGGVRELEGAVFTRTEIDILLDVLQTATVPFVEMVVEIIYASLAEERDYTPLAERRGGAQASEDPRGRKNATPQQKSRRAK